MFFWIAFLFLVFVQTLVTDPVVGRTEDELLAFLPLNVTEKKHGLILTPSWLFFLSLSSPPPLWKQFLTLSSEGFGSVLSGRIPTGYLTEYATKLPDIRTDWNYIWYPAGNRIFKGWISGITFGVYEAGYPALPLVYMRMDIRHYLWCIWGFQPRWYWRRGSWWRNTGNHRQ